MDEGGDRVSLISRDEFSPGKPQLDEVIHKTEGSSFNSSSSDEKILVTVGQVNMASDTGQHCRPNSDKDASEGAATRGEASLADARMAPEQPQFEPTASECNGENLNASGPGALETSINGESPSIPEITLDTIRKVDIEAPPFANPVNSGPEYGTAVSSNFNGSSSGRVVTLDALRTVDLEAPSGANTLGTDRENCSDVSSTFNGGRPANTRVSFEESETTVGGPVRRRSSVENAKLLDLEGFEDLDQYEGASSTGTRRNSNCSAHSNRSSVGNIWSKITGKSDFWETASMITDDVEDEDDDDTKLGCILSVGRWLDATLKTALTSPSVIFPCLFIFAVLCTVGIVVTNAFESAEIESRKEAAETVAVQTDIYFQRVLERAFVPLFTMAQFVQELQEFHEADFLVGDRCNATETVCPSVAKGGPAPPLAGKETTHRDLNGVFPVGLDDKFQQIAAGIKANSGLGRSLVNIQLAPHAVVSFLHPMVNCEDFENDYCMNNTGAWGHDLLNDPNRVGIARATVPADGVVTAGPLDLIQGGETFIARLPINMKGHSLVVDEVDYPCWGFAVVLLNWKTLKEDSNIYENFKREGMQFKLTRTDQVFENGEYKGNKVVVIAESPKSHLIAEENVTISLDTSANNWVMSVGYDEGIAPNYKRWAYPLTICLSFVFMMMLMLVLVSKKEHEHLLGKLLPNRAVKKLRRGQTVVEKYKMVSIFFSDIVGYTKLSSEMSPIEVMKMLNDLYSEFDKIAAKHGVFKVETIGDAYIAIAGAPKKCSGPEGAEKIALFALEAIEITKQQITDAGAKIFIRAGVASGPVVAGVVGSSLPKYTLFGDTVNFASRMESTSEKMRLQVSPITHRLLLDSPNYEFEMEQRRQGGELGVEVKGKGRQFTWWVNDFSKLSCLSGSARNGSTAQDLLKET